MLPNLANLVQSPFPPELNEWIEAQKEYFVLLEKDISRLIKKSIVIATLRSCYKRAFMNDSDILETIYEIHLASTLSCLGSQLLIHPQKGKDSKKRYDFRTNLNSAHLNFEMKTRKDMFPFVPGRRELFASGRRETVDKRFLGGTNDGTPESTIIRQIIDGALKQLPDSGLNYIVIGQICSHSIKEALANMDGAIFGDIVHYVERKNSNKILKRRESNGIFNCGGEADRYKKLNGIIWQHLEKNDGNIKEYSCILFNDNASVKTPAHIDAMLKRTFIRNMNSV